MSSQYLSRLNNEQRQSLIKELWEIQKGKCFISSQEIDLDIHEGNLDIDHVKPLKLGGKDSKENFALTFASANRSKQDSDLHVARMLYDFNNIEIKEENTNPNLDDLLKHYDGAKYKLNFDTDNKESFIQYSFSALGKNDIIKSKIYKDKKSGFDYFFEVVPIEFIYHDNFINPRTIGSNIAKLVKEFYKGNPQLHIGLAWIDITENKESEIRVFDGQHKTAAQLLLGVREVPLRIFINPDKNKLVDTNTKAGTTLRQVAFDKSVQRHLGRTLYKKRVERYQKDIKLDSDNFNFSEKDLINFYRGESREMKRYILDSVRSNVIHHKDNKLKEFVEFGGRAKEKPLSYSTIDKTFFSFFISSEPLETRISYGLEEGINPRELEKTNIIRLMNIIAEEILQEKFDFDIGTSQIESKVQKKKENISLEHLIACRMMKEEIIYSWLKYTEQIISSFFTTQGKLYDSETLFQAEFPEQLLKNIRNFVRSLADLPIWVNNELSNTIFGAKQTTKFWQHIFTTGKSLEGNTVLNEPLNILEMIKSKD